jgi:hypothetical protein
MPRNNPEVFQPFLSLRSEGVFRSMHRVLVIPGLFHQIVGYLRYVNENDDEDTDKGSLLHLAQTCRAFCDPALNVLWKELNYIHPLVSLLPCIKNIQPDGSKILVHLLFLMHGVHDSNSLVHAETGKNTTIK